MSVVCVILSARHLMVQTLYFYFFRVLMLRRKASPTETELRIHYSHLVDEALQMLSIEWHPEEISEDSTPTTTLTDSHTLTDSQA